MLHALRSALLPVLVLGVASALSGCKTDCDSTDKGATCISESTQQYLGTPFSREVTWVAGQALRIGVDGGNVRTGGTASTSITVNVHGSLNPYPGCTDVTKVCVLFTPINNDTEERVGEATRQMKQVADGGNLITNAADTGAGGVKIDVYGDTTNGGKFNSSLSALVDVLVPAGFDGDVIAISASGDISLAGTRRGLKTSTNNGKILVTLGSPVIVAAAGSIERSVTTGNGDILFSAATGSNISVQAQTKGVSSNTVRLIGSPAGWSQVEGSTEQSATFCGNAACTGAPEGNWVLTTELGNIDVSLF